jgi:DNA-binding CsgD family transcriptional regulator
MIFSSQIVSVGGAVLGNLRKYWLYVLGFSFYLLSTSLVIWGGIFTYLPLMSTDFILLRFSLPCFIGFIFGLIPMAFLYIRLGKQWLVWMVIVAGFAIMAGTAVTFLVFPSDAQMAFGLIISGALIGVGSGSFLVLWGIVFVRVSPNTLNYLLLFSIVVFSVFYLGIRLVPTPQGLISNIFIALMSSMTFILAFIMYGRRYNNFEKAPLSNKMLKEGFLRTDRDVVFILVSIAFIAAITRCVALNDVSARELVKDWSVIATALTAAIILVICVILKRIPSYSMIYRTAFPVIATGLLLLPIMDNSYRIVVSSITFSFFTVCHLLALYQIARMMKMWHSGAVVTFAWVGVLIYSAMLLGTFVGVRLIATSDYGLSNISTVALFLVYLLLIVMVTLNRSRHKPITLSPWKEENNESDKRRAVEKSSQILAARFALTAKETEVLLLLCKGRDTPYIAQKLHLSKNTVRTHNKNIYVKMGIHSRQELLSMFEDGDMGQSPI